MVDERILVGNDMLRMHGRKLQSAVMAGNGSVLIRLRLAAGTMAVLGMAGQLCVAGCQAAWPKDVTPS